MSYNEVINKILASSVGVRYVAVLDGSGNVVAGGMRPGVKSLGTEEDDRRFAHDVVLIKHVREEWDRLFGKVCFSISSRSTINIISIYLNSETLVVTTEPDVSLLLVDRIRDILRDHYITT
jgi:hypothetical protein